VQGRKQSVRATAAGLSSLALPIRARNQPELNVGCTGRPPLGGQLENIVELSRVINNPPAEGFSE